MLLLIIKATDRDNKWAASFTILGPKPSSQVNLEASKLLICNITCSGVIKGMVNSVLISTLLSTKSLILFRSMSYLLPLKLVSFRILATDAKYTFNGNSEGVLD